MLDEYVELLSNSAQLKIALRLCKLALPLWEKYFTAHADAMERVNALIQSGSRVKGGANYINADFPRHALERIEKNLIKAAQEKFPVAVMRENPQLRFLFATSMQPLTHPGWDDTIPRSVRLVYTSVWNILTWIVFRRKTGDDETHIYVAINQAADALLSEKIMTGDQIEEILKEYKDEKHSEEEEEAWALHAAEPADESPGLTQDEVYSKIIGETIVKDPPSRLAVEEILRQMREEDKSFWDKWDEYYSGTCKTYSYNCKEKSYWRTEADVIVASFFHEYAMSEEEMIQFISGISLFDLRENGFEV